MAGGEHRHDWVTTFPFTHKWPQGKGIAGLPATKGNVIIGHDVWIGAGALILSGVTVGNGAVIGARAVVASDVPPYAVAVGNPARVVKMRFPENTVARLLEIAWWNWPDARIAKAVRVLSSPYVDVFIAAVDGGKL
jgi:acetyltransferase-like isoleucine patch superfamily enzyme